MPAGLLIDPTLRAAMQLSLFHEYELLPFVGQADRLWKEFGGFWYRVARGVFSDAGKLVKSLSGIDLTSDTAKEILVILEDAENRKVLAEKLASLRSKLQLRTLVYNCVDAKNGRALLANAPPADSLVCVEACLATSSAILDFYPEGTEVLKGPDAWFLIDGTPNLIHRNNKNITGEFLILDLPKGFDGHFFDRPPFFPDIGWYPAVRITGYFRTASKQTRGLPALTVALIEYRRPIGYLAASDELARLLKNALQPSITGANKQPELETLAWLAPLIYKAHKQVPGSVTDQLLPELKNLQAAVGSGMPKRRAIRDFYANLPPST
jgi:hypothetical protein